ncbi:MAG: serine/threonine-protein kinase [Planctomycetaceae bacterium]
MDRVGPYVIDRKLGTGGMGTVYLAVHEETGRRAAVKVLPASLAREEGFLARFEREIAALRQIENPNVVKIFDSGTVSNGNGNDGESQAYYYAMEYVDGETLLARLRRERRLPWPVVIDYGSQICLALKAAHDAGIIHRDLKPSNLLVSRDGAVKLADFGVAQVFAASRLTKSGGIIGTAEFMSPEQAQGQRATKKSDLYALGAVMYTMLTGKPPYSGETMLDVLHKHRFGQFDRPRHYAPECPSWLEEIVCQLLEKEPDKRPADAYVTGKRLREIPRKVELSRSEPLPVYAAESSHGVGPPTGQEILSHEDDAADGESPSSFDADGDAVTRTAPDLTDRDTPVTRRGPGEATLMHALMRQEIARQQTPHPVQSFFENTWVLLGLLALLLIGGFFWYRSLPTPEWHWAEADRLIAAGDYSEARIEHLQPLVREGGAWKERAEARMEEARRLEREIDLERGIRRRRSGEDASTAATSDARAAEVDRLLRNAETHRALGDVAAATGILEALVVVIEGESEFADEREQAELLLGELHQSAAGQDGKRELIRSTLRKAGSLAETDKADSQKMYRELLNLYGNDPAVSELLEPARKALGE